MNKTAKRLSYTGIAAAIIFTITRLFIVPVPMTTTGSYVNMGDVAIYLVSFLFGGPLAAVAAGLGSAFSDLTANAALYAPATLVIKALMALVAVFFMRRFKLVGYIIGSLLAGIIMVVGYGLYDMLLAGLGAALTNAPANLIQLGGSFLITLVLYPVAVRVKKVTKFEDLR